MKLSDIFEQLTYGELSQISMGGGEAGVINKSNYSRVLAHVNLGLTALYKRFPLKEGRLTLTLQTGKTSYPLASRFVVGNRLSREALRYIQESPEGLFDDDILKIERVYTFEGWEMGLNDEADPYACFTPSATVLRVPGPAVIPTPDTPDFLKTATLEVVYRAKHKQLSLEDYDPDEVEVELPYSHLEPLLLYVASRVNNPMGMSGEFNAGNNYAAKYEKACQELEMVNLRVDQGQQSDRLVRNGWV